MMSWRHGNIRSLGPAARAAGGSLRRLENWHRFHRIEVLEIREARFEFGVPKEMRIEDSSAIGRAAAGSVGPITSVQARY